MSDLTKNIKLFNTNHLENTFIFVVQPFFLYIKLSELKPYIKKSMLTKVPNTSLMMTALLNSSLFSKIIEIKAVHQKCIN